MQVGVDYFLMGTENKPPNKTELEKVLLDRLAGEGLKEVDRRERIEIMNRRRVWRLDIWGE